MLDLKMNLYLKSLSPILSLIKNWIPIINGDIIPIYKPNKSTKSFFWKIVSNEFKNARKNKSVIIIGKILRNELTFIINNCVKTTATNKTTKSLIKN